MTAIKAPGRPAPSERAHLTLAEGLRALDKGTLSAEAWAQACLERIAQRNLDVKAWVHVAGESALAQARAIDRRGRRTRYEGAPIGIKDTIDTAVFFNDLG